MSSLLSSGYIKRATAAGFKGRLCKGVIRRVNQTVMDSYGDVKNIQEFGGTTDYPCEGIRDSFDARYKQQAMIPESDVKLLILLGSTKVIPTQTDMVMFKINKNTTQWFQVREVLEIDPAEASATLQAYLIPTPTGGPT